MALSRFERLKNKYHNTTPIRGRAIECRPIGERRRDWEQVVKVLTPFGEGYGARLYDTDCVVFAPNGDLYLQIDRWATPLTAQWIQRHSGLSCYKKYGEIWVEVDGRTVPISRGEKLHLRFKGDEFVHLRNQDLYICDKEVVREQKVVDRKKSKAERAKVKEFKDYVRVMMRIHDNVITHDIYQQYKATDKDRGYWGAYQYEFPKFNMQFTNWCLRQHMGGDVAKRLTELMERVMTEGDDIDKYKLMLCIAESCQCETRLAGEYVEEYTYDGNTRQITRTKHDYIYNPDAVVRKIDYIIGKAKDIYTTKTIKVDKPMSNLT